MKEGGRLVEEVYRVGGRYDKQIREIVRHLEAAVPSATAPMATALRALIRFYETGETADRIAYDIAWVQDRDSPVDTINGFVEVYMDARGMKGAWEALVYYVNPHKTAGIRKLAAAAQWFEDRMPWADKYKKQGVRGVSANAIDSWLNRRLGPRHPVGINLPTTGRSARPGRSRVAVETQPRPTQSTLPEFRRESRGVRGSGTRRKRSMSRASHTECRGVGHGSGRIRTTLGPARRRLEGTLSAIEEHAPPGFFTSSRQETRQLGLGGRADHTRSCGG